MSSSIKSRHRAEKKARSLVNPENPPSKRVCRRLNYGDLVLAPVETAPESVETAVATFQLEEDEFSTIFTNEELAKELDLLPYTL